MGWDRMGELYTQYIRKYLRYESISLSFLCVIHTHAFFFLSFFLSLVFLQRIYRQSRRSNLGWKHMMRQETQKNKEKKIFPSSFFFSFYHLQKCLVGLEHHECTEVMM